MARRKLSRRTRTAWWIAGGGIATGLAVVLLLPLIRKYLVKVSITVPQKEITVRSTDRVTAEQMSALLE